MNPHAEAQSPTRSGPPRIQRKGSVSEAIPGPSKEQGVSNFFHEWNVVMVGGCNLRCSYCATDFGRFGRKGGVMSLKTATPLAEQIAASVNPEKPEVKVSFGGGETFLHFDRFIKVAELISDRCKQYGVSAHFGVTTNGVLLNESRLQQLAERKVALTFSIDGPERVHDADRRSAEGLGSFRAAFANWQRYREIGRHLDDFPACLVHSVFGAQPGSLLESIEFWLDQGVQLQDFAPQMFSRFNPATDRRLTRRIQDRYLAGLREWALEQAQKCTSMSFLGEYRGPSLIYSGWKRLLFGQERPLCTPGDGLLAVDQDGILYPCDGYVGVERWQLGDVWDGIDRKRQRAFADRRAKAEAICSGCDDRIACDKPCLAATETATPAQNVRQQCGEMKRVAAILRESYESLVQNQKMGGANA